MGLINLGYSRRNFVFVVLFLCVLSVIYWTIVIHPNSEFNPRLIWQNWKNCQNIELNDDKINKTLLMTKLQSIQQKLLQLQLKGDVAVTPILQEMEDIMNDTFANDISVTSDASRNVSKAETEVDVCPEVYMGTKYGYMYFVTGWVMENCTNARPIENVISVVLNPVIEEKAACSQMLETLINGIRKAYREVKIIIPNYSVAFCSKEVNDSVHQVTVDKKWTPGRKWNALVKNVSTPYVFLGRDLDNFVGWISRLERQVRVISSIPRVQVAGGAVRNRTGHWRVGCYQSDMRNYVLRYEDGYFVSRNECMYCDYLMGPFVAKTELLKEIPFDEKLPTTVLFEDFFLKVIERSYLVMNCPDAMHFASDNTVFQKENNKQSWQPLVKIWELNRIVLPNGKVFGYSCEESGLKCSGVSGRTTYYLLPPCCLEQFAKAVSIFHEFYLKNNIFYEVEAGSALSLVKMSGYIPWDLDGDFTFYTKNLSLINSSVEHFKKFGIKLTELNYENKEKTRAYFRYRTPDLYIEFWGETNLSKDIYEPNIFRNLPTKARMHNMWIYSNISPGLYARNRYGIEILRHAQSWIHTGAKNSWTKYIAGKFKPCKNPRHHSCLDHFSTDGNVQFKIPTPS